MRTMPSVGEDREPLESSPMGGRAVTDTLQTNLAKELIFPQAIFRDWFFMEHSEKCCLHRFTDPYRPELTL